MLDLFPGEKPVYGPIAPEDAYDLPGTVHGLYKELADNVDRFGMLFRDWRGFAAGTDADDVLRAIDGAFGETEYSRARGRFPDATVAAWAAERSVNGSDVNLGIKERML